MKISLSSVCVGSSLLWVCALVPACGDDSRANTPPDAAVDGTTADGGSAEDASASVESDVELVVGGFHTCALVDGDVKCWGRNDVGQVGNGTYGESRNVLAPPSDLVDFGAGRSVEFLASGGEQNCAILDDGTVKCWGGNAYGELGYGENRVFPAPGAPDLTFEPYFGESTVDFGTGRSAEHLALGLRHSCALLDDESLKCWGDNQDGQLATGGTANLMAPRAMPANLGGRAVTRLVARGAFNCATFEDGDFACWGDNEHGQLGVGEGDDLPGGTLTPVDFGEGRTVRDFALGLRHVCVILDDSSLKCWGDNQDGQLGYGDTIDRTSPAEAAVNLGLGRTPRALALGGNFTCALLDDASVTCWGGNDDGALGLGDFEDRSAPPAGPVALSGQAVSIVAGIRHVCALVAGDTVSCWGWNEFGQLGVGDTLSRPAPTVVDLEF